MKLILFAFLLCGIAQTFGSPACSEDGFRECMKYDPRGENKRFLETQEDLDGFCKSTTCLIDYHEKCPNIGPDMPEMFKQYKVIQNAVCEKDSPIRQKYVDNAKCLNEKSTIVDEKCQVNRDKLDRNDPQFCDEVRKHLSCSYETISSVCGDDARDAYKALYPGLDFYGCNE